MTSRIGTFSIAETSVGRLRNTLKLTGKRMCRVFAAVLVLSAVGFQPRATFAGSPDKTITVVSGPYMPYLGDGVTTPDGFILEIFRTVFEGRGFTVEYVVGPWVRMLLEVQKGRYDGALLAAKENADEFGLFVDTDVQLGELELRFFVKKGNPWRYEDRNSLRGKVVGYIFGNPYFSLHDYISENKANPAMVQGNGGKGAILKNLKKLQAGRIDLIYEDKLNTPYEARQLNMQDEIEEVGGLDPPVPAYVAWTKKNPRVPQYSRILKDGIKELRASGQLKRILDKYGVADWE